MQKKLATLTFTLLTSAFILNGCASVSSSASADNSYAQAKQDFMAKNYPKAFVEVQAPAQAGIADAQYALGYMYFYGKGTPPDRIQAKYWFNKAAAQGQKDAIQALQLVQ